MSIIAVIILIVSILAILVGAVYLLFLRSQWPIDEYFTWTMKDTSRKGSLTVHSATDIDLGSTSGFLRYKPQELLKCLHVFLAKWHEYSPETATEVREEFNNILFCVLSEEAFARMSLHFDVVNAVTRTFQHNGLLGKKRYAILVRKETFEKTKGMPEKIVVHELMHIALNAIKGDFDRYHKDYLLWEIHSKENSLEYQIESTITKSLEPSREGTL